METQKILQSFRVNDELNPEIWDYTGSENEKEPQLQPEIDERLLEISENFISFLGVDVDVEDITMTGSLSNYNWSSFSDIDLHVLIDFDSSSIDKKVLRELFNAKQGIWNSLHEIELYGFEVELYAQDANEPHFSTGVYSVLNDEWIVSPNKLEDTWDENKVLKKAGNWLEDRGEFSYENLTFKFLRRNGYLKKLSDLKNKVTDENLSLGE